MKQIIYVIVITTISVILIYAAKIFLNFTICISYLTIGVINIKLTVSNIFLDKRLTKNLLWIVFTQFSG